MNGEAEGTIDAQSINLDLQSLGAVPFEFPEDMTFGEYEAMSPERQQMYDSYRARMNGGRCEDCYTGFDAGTSSFSDMLCKLWRWIVGAAKAIVDGVKTVLVDLADAVFDILSPIIEGILDVGGSTLKSPLVWIAGGVALFWLLGRKKDEKSGATIMVPSYSGMGGRTG